MKVVLVCLDNFQDYILINIKQLILLNHHYIYVITNYIFFNKFNEYRNRIKLIAVEDLNDSYNYTSKTILDKSFRNGFWVHSSSRFFYIYEFMKKYNINNIIHLENDVLIYYNTDLLIDKIDNNCIYLPFDSFDRNIASIMYIPNHNILKEVLDNYDISKNDMYNFSSIMKKTNLINNFPIFISNISNNNEEYNFVTKNYEKIGFIFDAAAIGQYLGGIDKNNDSNDTTGFINETCVIKYNNYKFILRYHENIIKPFILFEEKYIPIFNLHIHSKNLNKFIYENKNIDEVNKQDIFDIFDIFDIVIPVGINDIECIEKQIIFTKKNIIGYRNIYIVSNCKNIIVDGCILIDEDIFPFNIKKISDLHGKINRNSWYLQQLIKLYSGQVIPDILERYLVIDSDTFFLKPTKFIKDNKLLFNYRSEYNKPYFEHMYRVHPFLEKIYEEKSGICHHMIFEKKYINELICMVEDFHKKQFWIVFLEEVSENQRNHSGASEYEMYFNFMLKKHPDKIELRYLNYSDINTLNTLNTNNNFDYVSYHHYLRQKKYIIFKKSGRLGNALFRYFASILFCIKNNYEYILEEECPKINEYIFYKGVDHLNDDIDCINPNIDNLINICNNNKNALCFNTLGYLKSDFNLDKLNSNEHINHCNNHGLYVKNIINIDDNNYFKHYNNCKINNLIMDGYFHFDKIYLEHKNEIIDFIEKNKNYHKIKTDRNEIFLIKDLIDNIHLDTSKIYDIVLHLRLEDFRGLDDFIEYNLIIYLLKKLNFNNIFNNKKCAIVVQKIYNNKDEEYINNLLNWFKQINIEINIECNDLIIDFNIMKQCKTLICSNSTLSWTAAYLSKNIELCYMPLDKNRNNNKRFIKPIENTVFFDTSKKKNCYICGCVLNCEKYLKNVFKNIKKIGELFDDYKVIIAYDESNDNTLNTLYKLKNICELEIIINKNKMSKYKTENISNARNSILEFIKNENNDDYEYFIMMDFDDVCEKEIIPDILNKYLINNTWDSLSFNRKDYYDIWALSIKPYVTSCWHWNEKQNGSSFVVDLMKKYINNKLNNLDKDKLLECYSAFNGFAIYKKDKFINCIYNNSIFRSHGLIDNDLIRENLNEINKITGKNNSLFMNLLEDCEHRYFHLSAIEKNNAKIMISPLYLFNENSSNETNENISNETNKNKEEDECIYVSSRGILKSCNVKSTTPISSIKQLLNYDFSKLYDGCTLYVCNYAIPYFSTVINKINNKFILVSGDSDCTVPDELFKNNNEFHNFINNEKIIHWYSQNCILDHKKLSRIPIGLDYHTMKEKDSDWGEKIISGIQEYILNYIKKNSKPFWEREVKCYSNFHFFTNTKYGNDRIEALTYINKNLVFYENTKINRKQTWENQSKYVFVISPHGNGLDCHRTWEALCLGCIPIVKKSGISNLFDELPVLIVEDWKHINIELLNDTINKFKNSIFNYDKLKLKYWVDKIKTKKIKWNIISPEIKYDLFYNNIIELISKSDDITNILEIGASSGDGSTEAFIIGKKNKNIKLFSIEVCTERFDLLKNRYSDDNNFYPYNISSVSLIDFPLKENIIQFHNNINSILSNTNINTILSWYDSDISYIKINNIEENGIDKIKEEHYIKYFDCVLIDGSEFTGKAEYDKIYGAKYILLDDINAYKNYYTHLLLKNDNNYSCLCENYQVRNGFSIFKKII